MTADETGMLSDDAWKRAKEAGKIEERVDTIRRDQQSYAQATDLRFLRLEDKITEGFASGQRDRELGNTTLGQMIETMRIEVKAVVATINRGQGAITMGDKIIGVAIVIGAAALGGWLSHF